ncbi:MAG TPA: hypothetical protein VK750_07500 [Cytophagaceae bacterium]|jgi:hypothetical protein|nr:hypothetical protein [Cytophagaceae bacterium]
MKLNILKHEHLPSIPSGSGVELVDGIIYIIGDDSEYLYGLNHELKVIHQVELFHAPEKKDGRIPKPLKTDFESMVSFNINGYTHLFVAGSGSKLPQRGKGYLIKLPTSYNKKHIVWEKDLNALYQLITSHPDFESPELNIEASFIADDHFYFVNRAGQQLIRYPLPEMIEFLQGHTESTPFPEIFLLDIPKLNGLEFSCSGACYFNDTVYITASCEATDNAYDDGEILGSAIGTFSLNALPERGREKNAPKKIRVENMTLVLGKDNNPLISKWESICIYEQDKDGTLATLAVADPDNGTSELFLLEIML